MATEIFVSNSEFPLVVDDEVGELFAALRWHAQYNGHGNCYARTHIAGTGLVTAHQYAAYLAGIENPENYPLLDHIDGNGLNCQSWNLRWASKSLNAANRLKDRDNQTGYKGVTYRKGKYVAQITENGFSYHKAFDYAEDAAKQYDEWAMEFFGQFAVTNFNYEGI